MASGQAPARDTSSATIPSIAVRDRPREPNNVTQASAELRTCWGRATTTVGALAPQSSPQG